MHSTAAAFSGARRRHLHDHVGADARPGVGRPRAHPSRRAHDVRHRAGVTHTEFIRAAATAVPVPRDRGQGGRRVHRGPGRSRKRPQPVARVGQARDRGETAPTGSDGANRCAGLVLTLAKQEWPTSPATPIRKSCTREEGQPPAADCRLPRRVAGCARCWTSTPRGSSATSSPSPRRRSGRPTRRRCMLNLTKESTHHGDDQRERGVEGNLVDGSGIMRLPKAPMKAPTRVRPVSRPAGHEPRRARRRGPRGLLFDVPLGDPLEERIPSRRDPDHGQGAPGDGPTITLIELETEGSVPGCDEPSSSSTPRRQAGCPCRRRWGGADDAQGRPRQVGPVDAPARRGSPDPRGRDIAWTSSSVPRAISCAAPRPGNGRCDARRRGRQRGGVGRRLGAEVTLVGKLGDDTLAR